jgi:hypothetical protein
MHLQNGGSAGNDAYVQKGTTSRVMVASRPKVSSGQMAALVPEIMDGSNQLFPRQTLNVDLTVHFMTIITTKTCLFLSLFTRKNSADMTKLELNVLELFS